jgi:DNA-binding SARP family transcriptional activator
VAQLEVRLLGFFSVRLAGQELPPRALGGRLGRMLRILVTRRGELVSRDFLIEALWPGRAPADPAGNLSVLVTRARRALGDPSLIVTGPGGYSFAAGERCVVDAEVFLAQVATGRELLATGRPSAGLGCLRKALAGWGGEPLAEDAYEDWAREYRDRLARAHLEALEAGAGAALGLGDPEQAVAMAEPAVAREPLREAANLLLVRALAASGDTAAALAAFDAFRRRLAEELGLDPSPEALELQARILRGEVATSSPRPPSLIGQRRLTIPPRPAFEELPFIGRDKELQAILDVLFRPAPGSAVVAGPAGAGKSRLLAEVGVRSTVPVLGARAFLPEREDAWGLARSLLREALALDPRAARAVPDRAAQALAYIVPELEDLALQGRESMDAESRRALALEAGVRLIEAAASGGALLFADDLQWADATSLVLLGLVIRRIPRLGVVLAYRPEEVSAQAASLLTQLPRLDREVLTVRLGRLSQKDVGGLISDAGLAQTIVQETDGTPLAVSEVVRELARRGAIELDAHGRWRLLSETVNELACEIARLGQRRSIRSRADQQPAGRRRILALLALLGREAPPRVLAAAIGAEEASILEDLGALARARLVRLGDEGWASAHDLISESIVEGLDRAERGQLHAMLARALSSQGADPSEVARHLAGAGDTEAAAESFSRAARQSLEQHASGEAERLANAGLALHPEPSLSSELLSVRAESRARRGDLAGAREDLRGAMMGKPTGPDRSRILARMAMLASGAEDLVRAEELVKLAIAEAAQDPETRANALSVGAVVDMNAGRQERAHARFDEALALFEGLGNARGIAHILDCRAMQTFLEGNIPEATDAFDRAARLFTETGELLRVGTPQAMRGVCLTFMGRPEDGLPDIEEALELERSLGHAEGESYALWYRAEALAMLGRDAEAFESAKGALTIAERLGHRELIAGALRGLGIVHRAAGDLEGAEGAFRRSLEVAGEHLPLFAGYAASSLASVLIARGRLAEAEPFIAQAFAVGLPVNRYEARLTGAELAVARDDPNAAAIVAEALAMAETGGHLATVARLKRLTASEAGA